LNRPKTRDALQGIDPFAIDSVQEKRREETSKAMNALVLSQARPRRAMSTRNRATRAPDRSYDDPTRALPRARRGFARAGEAALPACSPYLTVTSWTAWKPDTLTTPVALITSE
jgi:hypothetical protein